MTDKTYPLSDDQGLKRLLEVLRPPAPSDLLRVRVEKAITRGPVSGLTAGSYGAAAKSGVSSRASRYARFAAGLLVVAGVGLALWVPAPPHEGGSPVPRQMAATAVGGDRSRAYVAPPYAQGNGTGTDLGVTLTGGGAAFTGIPLVRANWPTATAYTDGDPGFGGDASYDLESIPLY